MWANTFREERSEIEGLFENVKTMCEQNENAPLPSDYVERYVGVGVFFCLHFFLAFHLPDCPCVVSLQYGAFVRQSGS